jgi:hypothetical protein
MSVEPEVNGHTNNNQIHQHSNRRFKEKFEAIPGKLSTDSP